MKFVWGLFLLTLVPLGSATLAAQTSFEDIAKPPAANWLSYSGDYSGRRFSTLDEIKRDNVANLAPKWVFHVPDSNHLESSPVVVDGVMYITNSNEVYALDALTGRPIWHYKYPRSKMTNSNRGVAVLGDRLFFVSSDACLIALNRKTGAVLWQVQYADSSKGYGASLAPLATKDKIIVGVSGGDCGIRGFVDAYEAESGKHAWRFWTIPGRGEPGYETWGGQPMEYSGGATWMTGTYDPVEDTVFWTAGNPGPNFYAGARPGDNLYSNSLLALDAATGKRRWHFQFTPHDTHDWDAEEMPVLVDTTFQDRSRKLVLHADRNGFFYVLDRNDGHMLLGKPFVKKLTWARGILPDGRPDKIAGMDATPKGKLVCPGAIGATNWFSPSFNPHTGLFYVMSVERCDLYTSSAAPFTKGQCYSGTGVDQLPSDRGQFVLRAIDIQTGRIRWEKQLVNEFFSGSAMPGTLATAGDLLFFADDAGYLAAADARTGDTLWHFYTGQFIAASPITYSAGGKQFVEITSATDVFSFGLFEPSRPVPQPLDRSSSSPASSEGAKQH
jgi:alcohol dehydrogenase (cytochrome c)